MIQIHYLKTGSFKVIDIDGDVIEPNDFDDSIGQPAELSDRGICGENRFVGVENYLEFYLGRNCFV